MKNKALILVFITLLSSTFLVSANDDTSTLSTSTGNTVKIKTNNNLATARNQLKESIAERKKERIEFTETQKEKRQEIIQNRKDFKENNGNLIKVFSGITDEQKQELQDLRDSHKTATKEIIDQLKSTTLTLEERETLRTQLETLNNQFYDDMEVLFESNEEILAFLQAREELRIKNQELRDEAKKTREEYRQGRDEQVEAQKEYYLNKLVESIPNVSDTKLESIKTKAQAMLDKIEANTKLSDEKKDEIAAKVIALIEILDEEIENRGVSDEELNIDEILTTD